MKKKILIITLAVMLIAVLSVGVTLAYMTDRDEQTNTFTVGNVDIVLNEVFEQDSQLMPGWKINKDVTIENVGTNDAWVWYTYAIPASLDTPKDASKNVLHVNHAGANWLGYQDNKAYWAQGQTTPTPEEQCWIPDYNPVGDNGIYMTQAYDQYGILYNVYVVLYNGPLAAGDETTIGLTQVYMDAHVDVDPEGKLYIVDNGEVTPIEWVDTNPVMIYVNAYAIQKQGFENAHDAFKAYFGQWGELQLSWATDGLPAQ
ncbi:MAG: hypothetical protein J6S14_03580 [Clostridia bacterium]|nr:hypothetical protein [Clostridia bacterium]